MNNEQSHSGELKIDFSSISIMRLLMAYLIICSHAPYRGGMTFINNFCWCAVIFFMLVSGFFAWNKDEKKRKKKMFRHFNKTALAYVIGYSFYYFISVWIKYFCNDIFKTSISVQFERWSILQFIKNMLTNNDPFCSHLWYLYFLAIVYVIMYFFCYEKLKEMLLAIVVSLYVCTRFGALSFGKYDEQINRIILFMFIFYLGYFYHYLIEKYSKILTEIKCNIIVFLSIALLWLLDIGICTYITNKNVEYNNYVAMLLFAISIKNPTFGKNTFLEEIGKNYTLDIYIYHIFILHMVERVSSKLALRELWIFKEVEIICILIATVIFAFIKNAIKSCIVRLFKKNKKEIDNKA